MRRILLCCALMSAFICCVIGDAQNFSEVKPSPQQVQRQDMEFGVIVHFSLNTFLNQEWGDGTTSPNVFNPSQVNTDQWMEAIRASGAKYIVLVAKHHDGFCLWPTKYTDYSVKNSPWEGGKGDLVRMVSDSAKKYGLKFGIYLSPWDRHDPRYKDSKQYDQYYSSLLDELVTQYGEITEFWLDGAGSQGHIYDFPRIIEELRTYQPNALVFADTGLFEYGDIHWAGSETGVIPYENWNVVDRHGYLRWRPAEADTPLRKLHWFWKTEDETSLKSVAELMDIYENSIGHGGQMMLGLAPDRRGLLPDSDVKRLKEFGEAMQNRYGRSLTTEPHSTPDARQERAFDGNPDTFWSAPRGSHEAKLEIDFAKPITFNHAMAMEWLNDGQHVQKYAVEVWTGKQWTAVASGYAIGHKKIDYFPSVTASRVRLNILSSTSEAYIREFQLFDVKQ